MQNFTKFEIKRFEERRRQFRDLNLRGLSITKIKDLSDETFRKAHQVSEQKWKCVLTEKNFLHVCDGKSDECVRQKKGYIYELLQTAQACEEELDAILMPKKRVSHYL